MKAAQKKVAELILHPEQACVVRADGGVEQLSGIGAISVDGGVHVPGDGRFTVGYRSPEVVGVVMLDGRRQKFTGARAVLIKGGTDQKAPVIGGGGLSRRLAVDDEGVGLGQIDNLRGGGPYIDEIDKYLEDKAKAGLEVGGDEFYTRVRMKHDENSSLNKQAPYTRTNPATAINNVLGNQVGVIFPGAVAGASVYSVPQQVALWEGHDAETTAVTVVFGPVGNLDPPKTLFDASVGLNGIRPVGIVKFGTRGYLMVAEVDILTGCQLTVCASYVILEVKGAGTWSPGGVDTPVNLGGMLSFYPSVRTAPLTRTLYWNVLAAAGVTTNLVIPAFAKNLIVRRTVIGDGFTIVFLDSSRNGSIYTHIVAGGSDMTIPVLLPGNAYAFNVTNNGGTSTDFAFIFELGL